MHDHPDLPIGSDDATNRPDDPPSDTSPAIQPLVSYGMLEESAVIGKVYYFDPDRCLPYDGSPRAGYRFDERRDADLYDDIRVHGVIEPIIVMRHHGKRVILSGNRRHAIVTHLRGEGLAIPLPVRDAYFSELEAVAFAAACNVGRAAPTAMESARTVRWTLDHVEPNQAEVARVLGMDQAKVSHLRCLADLPEWVTDIVTDPDALSVNFAAIIGPALADAEQRAAMAGRADRLKAENRTVAGPAAARFLKTGEIAGATRTLHHASGVALGSIKRDSRGGISLRLSPAWRKDRQASDQLIALVSTALKEAMQDAE